ncbi:MAG: TrkH family potassium uptake protein [Syntrophomonadaceae bacterium]|nr:TrkH family potassium uptake protein [Syntrophomonadaceae bacterium]MDD3022574.1 TrkH family potassium uptake protein [Syntrophomonadaceae bacterium]
MNKQTFFNPPLLLILSFILVILIGSLLLSMPWAVQSGQPDYITSLFTAVSATCVTGLVVVDTASHWTIYGHVVLLILMQIGGLGIMTFVTFFAILIGRNLNLKQKIVLQLALNRSSLDSMVKVLKYILVFSLLAETLGAIVLFFSWMSSMGIGTAAWYAVFHAVSAFNNAGFDLFGNFQSLQGFVHDPIINLTTSTLFIVGSLGFLVIYDLLIWREQRELSLHTRLVLLGTLTLIIGGAVLIFLLEFNNAFGQMTLGQKGTASFFLSATRTAGFSTIDMTQTLMPTQILLMILMFIGGAPGSTAGGIKITTMIILFSAMLSLFRNKNDVEIWNRRLSEKNVMRALAILFLALSVIVIDVFILSFFHTDLTKVLFEVVSATSTVGLSLGLTQELGLIGKLLIIVTMFVGRLGPITIGFALAYGPEQPKIRYPKDEIMLG